MCFAPTISPSSHTVPHKDKYTGARVIGVLLTYFFTILCYPYMYYSASKSVVIPWQSVGRQTTKPHALYFMQPCKMCNSRPPPPPSRCWVASPPKPSHASREAESLLKVRHQILIHVFWISTHPSVASYPTRNNCVFFENIGYLNDFIIRV